MDFFNFHSTPRQRTQVIGRRQEQQLSTYQESPPQPMHRDIADMSLRPRDDLYLRPMEGYTEAPEEMPLSAVKNYFVNRVNPMPLPILNYRENIIQTVQANMVTIVTAPTGSGKSTQVPQYILDSEYLEGRHCKIVVTQPRRVAATSLARRVLQERNLPDLTDDTKDGSGTLVGYQIGMDHRANQDTRLTYMTTGVLLRKLICNQSLGEFTHIVLDEVHERDKDSDFLLLLVKRLLSRSLCRVRVVVMSATVDAKKFSQYFQTLSYNGYLSGAPIIEVEQKMFDVRIHYLETVADLIEQKLDSEDLMSQKEATIEEKMYQRARSLLNYFDSVGSSGSVLVFLPGIYEIESMQRVLEDRKDRYEIICLHSSIPRQYQNRMFLQPPEGKRKVILSTNIAESSITVPDIKYVVDFCLTKELYADSGTGMSSLKYVWSPKSSLDQRKGRAGRVAEGECFRLITERYMSNLLDYSKPEMQRCSIEQLILWCKILNIGDPKEMLSYALDPPDLNKLKEGSLLLLEVGALVLPRDHTSIRDPLRQELSFLGHIMGNIPLDVRLTRLIMFGLVYDCLTECVVMAACLSLPTFLETPFNDKSKKLETYVSRMKSARGTFSDPIMMYLIYDKWYDLTHNSSKNEARLFCQDKFLNHNRLNEVASLVQDIISYLKGRNIPDSLYNKRGTSGNVDDVTFRLKLALAGANYPFYYKVDKYVHDSGTCIKEFGNRKAGDTVYFTGMRLPVRQTEFELEYKDQISSYFSRYFDSIKRITLSSGKVYVTFDMSNEQEVSKNVFYALKMKQLGIGLNLQYQRHVGLITESSGKALHLPKGNTGHTVSVIVTFVESPTRFFVQFQEPHSSGDFKQLTEMIQAEHGRLLRFNPRKIAMDVYGLTYFGETDQEFLYRVKVQQINKDGGRFLLKVKYVDYGNSEWIEANGLFQISKLLLEFCPFQAVECSIEGVSRNLRTCLMEGSHGPMWSRDFVFTIKPLLENKKFQALVFYNLHEVLQVDLLDGNNSFKEYLISHEYVEKAVSNWQAEYVLTAEQDSRYVTVYLPTVSISTFTESSRDSSDRPEVSRCRLSGPSNPYMAKFTGLSDLNRNFCLEVSKESVCSVMICTNPANKFTELITASSVALASSGTRIDMRGVTRHCPIRGFADLMVLLYAPKVQLHSTESRLNYVGCRAGLGLDYSCEEALWSDHDLCLAFDQRLYSSDIESINQVRLRISEILEGGDVMESADKFQHVVGVIRKKQKQILQMIRFLLKEVSSSEEERTLKQVEFPKFSWRPSHDTINILERYAGYQGSDTELLRPHNCLGMMEEGSTEVRLLESREMNDRIEDLREHIRYLKVTTGVNSSALLTCELCNRQVSNPRELKIHLTSEEHLSEEGRLELYKTIS